MDYNRHLDEITTKTYDVILKIAQQCLITGTKDTKVGRNATQGYNIVSSLFKKWEEYRTLTNNSGKFIKDYIHNLIE